jgi:hypothetical protein
MKGKRNSCRILVGRAERQRPVGRPGYRREDEIKMVLSEIVWGNLGWIRLAQDRDK